MWNFPVEKGKVFSEGRENPPSVTTWFLVKVLRRSQGFFSSLSFKTHSSGIYFPPGSDSVPIWNSTNVDLFQISQQGTTFFPFFKFFFLKWIPALSSAGAEQKPLWIFVFSVYSLMIFFAWLLFTFWQQFAKSRKYRIFGLKKNLCSGATLVVNFVRFGIKKKKNKPTIIPNINPCNPFQVWAWINIWCCCCADIW